jgi:hypothetical protein
MHRPIERLIRRVGTQRTLALTAVGLVLTVITLVAVSATCPIWIYVVEIKGV